MRPVTGAGHAVSVTVRLSKEPVGPEDDPVALAFLLEQPTPGLLDALLVEHVDDGGGNCAGCTDSEAVWAWPCEVWKIADRASGVRALRARVRGTSGA